MYQARSAIITEGIITAFAPWATVPEEAAGYLVFTIVRNPYDLATSGHFTVTWDEQHERIVTAADQVAEGQLLVTETGKGEFKSKVL